MYDFGATSFEGEGLNPAMKQLKQHLLRFFVTLPPEWRWGTAFSGAFEMLRSTERWSAEDLRRLQKKYLKEVLTLAVHDTQAYGNYKGLIDRFPDGWPLVSKTTLRENRADYLARSFDDRMRLYCSTGGTTGRPFEFFYQKDFSVNREKAFFLDMWSRIGFKWHSKVARLRGDVFTSDEVKKGIFAKEHFERWEFGGRLLLSSFHMNDANLRHYAELIRKKNIEYLHAYFSSAVTFAEFLWTHNIKLSPPLKGVFCGSENLYPGQREIIEKGFGCRMFSFYGHSEKCVLAGECEHNNYYHVYPQYGVLELLDEQDLAITETGKMGRIVGTGFNNFVMPFIRYETDDFAEYLSLDGCPECGRHYPVLRAVQGRWLQEHLVNGDGNLVSMTALNIHSDLMRNVQQFQFYQDKRGEVELRIVPKMGFSVDEEGAIIGDLRPKLGERTVITIKRVDRVQLSNIGKYRFIIQMLSIDKNVCAE